MPSQLLRIQPAPGRAQTRISALSRITCGPGSYILDNLRGVIACSDFKRHHCCTATRLPAHFTAVGNIRATYDASQSCVYFGSTVACAYVVNSVASMRVLPSKHCTVKPLCSSSTRMLRNLIQPTILIVWVYHFGLRYDACGVTPSSCCLTVAKHSYLDQNALLMNVRKIHTYSAPRQRCSFFQPACHYKGTLGDGSTCTTKHV